MTQDVSGFGLTARLIADSTYPTGISITQFADDSDPLDMAAVQIADVGMGLNGDLVKWEKAAPIPCVLNVIPGSPDDINLQILADSNRVGQGKISAYDDITLTLVYPDGAVTVLTGGIITNAVFGKPVSQAGRLKTRTYSFMFESKTGA